MYSPRVRLLVASLAMVTLTSVQPANAKTTIVRQIPFSTWLTAQGIRLVGWQGRTGPQVNPPLLGNIARIDYAGGRAQAFGLSFGFNASGSVTERQFSDGTAEVTVNASFTNAITWASDANGVLIFAYTPAELAADNSLTPGLSNGHLQAKYTVPDGEAPELNLAAVVFNGAGTILSLQFSSSASGPLRAGFGVAEGTPGRCGVSQVGLFTLGGGATADQFPVEHVDVSVAGSGLQSQVPSLSLSRLPSPLSSGAPTAARSWGSLKARYRDAHVSDSK